MKNSRFQFEYRASASKLHRAVGEILRNSDIFANYEIYQEYPVDRVNENYNDSSHHFDWVIPKLFLVLECHGKQHYVATAFDGDLEKASENFRSLKERDEAKKLAALRANYNYVVIPYHAEKKLTEEKLLEYIDAGKAELLKWQVANAEVLRQEQELNRLKQEAELESKKQQELDTVKRQQQDNKLQKIMSEKHRESLIKAREYRKSKYQFLKDKRNANR
jgi:hypothetical protein